MNETARTKSKLDVLSLIVSFCAFAVSAATLYYTSLRQQDDLRFAQDAYPQVKLIDSGASTQDVEVITSNETLLIINLGNRPAAITSILLTITTAPEDSKSECSIYDSSIGPPVPFDIDPFVVEPGKINAQRLKLSNGKYVHSIRNTSRIQVCITFNIVTPDNQTVAVTKLLGEETIGGDGQFEPYDYPPPFTPQILFKNWKFLPQ